MKIETGDVVDPAEVAEIIGINNVNGVSVYRRRYEDFPEPVIEKGKCILWLRQDVERWAVGHRRQPGPEPGTPRRR
jgi:hypothetical protein